MLPDRLDTVHSSQPILIIGPLLLTLTSKRVAPSPLTTLPVLPSISLPSLPSCKSVVCVV